MGHYSLPSVAYLHSEAKAGAKVRQLFELCKYFYEKSAFYVRKRCKIPVFNPCTPQEKAVILQTDPWYGLCSTLIIMRKLLFILLWMPTVLFAQNDVLNRFFQTITTHTLQADFRITIAAQANQPITYNGDILMQGEKFLLTMGDMEIAYDGTTLYNYSESVDELTLSTPTVEELQQANPLLFAQALVDNCTIRQQEANGNYIFTLVPTNAAEAGVQQFTLQLRKSDLLPLKAVMKESVQNSTTLQLLNASYTTATPSFTLHKEGAYVNDLR